VRELNVRPMSSARSAISHDGGVFGRLRGVRVRVRATQACRSKKTQEQTQKRAAANLRRARVRVPGS
jgi:hypothetical protein